MDNPVIINKFGFPKKFVFVGIPLIIFVVLVLLKGLTVIPAGSTGVTTLFGRVSDKPLSSGLHLINPLRIVHKMSIRTEEYTMTIGEGHQDDSIWALTKEGLKVVLDITVLYHLDEQKAPMVFRDLGKNYEEKIIRPAIRTSIRDVVAVYEAKDIYSDKRQEVAQGMLDQIKKVEERGVVIENVLLRNVNLPTELSQSIEDKLKSEQEAQAMDFVLDKEKKEAERRVIEADGIKKAQDVISRSLTPSYLRWYSIEMMRDLADSPNSTFLFVPTDENGMPIINVNP